MILFFVLAVYILMSVWGLVLLKKGLINAAAGEGLFTWMAAWNLATDIRFLSGFALYLGGFLIWLYILSRYELSFVFPIASGALCLGTMAASYLILNEMITGYRVAGTLMVVLGIILISRS